MVIKYIKCYTSNVWNAKAQGTSAILSTQSNYSTGSTGNTIMWSTHKLLICGRKFKMYDWCFSSCVSQSLLQTYMRKQILHTLRCHTDTIPRKDHSLGHSRQSILLLPLDLYPSKVWGFYFEKAVPYKDVVTEEVNLWYCKLIRLCYIVRLFSNRTIILTVSAD